MPRAPRKIEVKPKFTRDPSKTTSARGYGHAHRKFRERMLKKNPLCQVCGNDWATDLHHRDKNPHNRAEDNALMVCERCHHTVIHGGEK